MMFAALSRTWENLGDRKPYALLGGMVVGQAVVWSWLYHKKGPLRKPIWDFVEADPERKRLTIKNMTAAEAKQDEGVIQSWNFWMVVGLHHGLGALTAAVGMLTKNVTIFRIGLSFEIGEDILHWSELAYTLLFPPGTEMFTSFCVANISRFAMICHHSIGVFAGSWVFLTIPHWWEAQSLVVLLLGAAVPQLMHYPAMPFADLRVEPLSPLARSATYTMISGTYVAVICRVGIFPPLAYAACQKVKLEYGAKTANALGSICGLFSIFILLSTMSVVPYVKEARMHLLAKPEDFEVCPVTNRPPLKRRSMATIMMDSAQATAVVAPTMQLSPVEEDVEDVEI